MKIATTVQVAVLALVGIQQTSTAFSMDDVASSAARALRRTHEKKAKPKPISTPWAAGFANFKDKKHLGLCHVHHYLADQTAGDSFVMASGGLQNAMDAVNLKCSSTWKKNTYTDKVLNGKCDDLSFLIGYIGYLERRECDMDAGVCAKYKHGAKGLESTMRVLKCAFVRDE